MICMGFLIIFGLNTTRDMSKSSQITSDHAIPYTNVAALQAMW